jgi:hypothetical protein
MLTYARHTRLSREGICYGTGAGGVQLLLRMLAYADVCYVC